MLLRPCRSMLAAFAAVDDVDDESAEAEVDVAKAEEKPVQSVSALAASSLMAAGAIAEAFPRECGAEKHRGFFGTVLVSMLL